MSKDSESAAKIDKATTHWLHRSNGTHSTDLDMPIPVLPGILGHSNISVTCGYFLTKKDALSDAIKILAN